MLSDSDIAFIKTNREKLTPQAIAKKLRKNISTIFKAISSLPPLIKKKPNAITLDLFISGKFERRYRCHLSDKNYMIAKIKRENRLRSGEEHWELYAGICSKINNKK